MGVLGGGWTMESGGGQGRGGWIKESVNLVSVGGWVCVCVGVLSVGLGPGLDSMSPARSRRSASHAAGTHGWLPQKTGRRGRWIQFAQCSPWRSSYPLSTNFSHQLNINTTDIATGFNQRKPPRRTVCVAIDLTAAFDTVSHDTLISKIAGSSLLPAITRWLSFYLRGRQAATNFRGTKSSTRIVRTGVPQGSKLSHSLFNYYIADMARPTPSVKRVCCANDITVWASP